MVFRQPEMVFRWPINFKKFSVDQKWFSIDLLTYKVFCRLEMVSRRPNNLKMFPAN